MENNQEIEDLILSTLSFYESMSFSQIVFDMDTNVLKQLASFDKDQMELVLNSLEKKGMVKKTGIGSEALWQRIHKKRPLWRRFIGQIYKYF
jgi:hypothetical protein